MSTPEGEEASPSPDYSGPEDHDADMAAEQRTEQSADASSDHKPAAKSSSSKDPTRPRRKKARRACHACQRAHLTCGDERPCHRCIKRNLGDSCQDGVRKKAKYLHDAPDGALLPGAAGHYPHVNGSHQVPLPSQNQPVTAAQPTFYSDAPPAAYYAQNQPASQGQQSQNAAFNAPQPMSPPYNQAMQTPMSATSAPQAPPAQMNNQFGGPLFDPSDPALFNFDISSLNFGNHYGALELGMLGHMSSAVGEASLEENPLNQAAGLYSHQIAPGTYGDSHGMPAHISFGPDGLADSDWQNAHSRNTSLQIQTPHNTPNSGNLEYQGHRNDSLNGPPAYAIGQGPPSISSASPASTDVNAGYENDNPAPATTFFTNSQQSHAQRSPTTGRLHQDARPASGPLQPLQSNAIRKRQQSYKPSIYATITKAYNYNAAFHRLFQLLSTRYAPEYRKKATLACSKFRPVLLTNAHHLDAEDLIFQEKNLQRSLVTMLQNFAEVGTPCLICRRSGEVVGMNKEFEILTGWKRDVLLGHVPNKNVNRGPPLLSAPDNPSSAAAPWNSPQLSRTPVLPGQDQDPGPHPVNILELMDQASGVQYLEDFSSLCYEDPLGKGHRRVNMLMYLTKEEMARRAEREAAAAAAGAGGAAAHQQHAVKMEQSVVKHEDASIHQGEAAMRNLGPNGLIDAMIMWHIKRDNFDMPMLIAMQIMPMLKP